MIQNFLLAITLSIIVAGCSSYPHKVFKDHTGLEFGRDVNLCPGAGVVDQKSCKPSSDKWKKANKVTGLTLEKDEKIFQRVDDNYLLQKLTGNQRTIIHEYDLWASSLNDPKARINVKDKIKGIEAADYIIEPFVEVNISELYEKDAVESAIATLNAEAKIKDVKLDTDFVVNVKAELQKKIKDSKNTSLTFVNLTAEYVGELANGEEDSKLNDIEELSKTVDSFNNNTEIIVGINGMLFSNLKAEQTVVEEKMLTESIDVALKISSPANFGKIEEMKSDVAGKWSRKVNEKINTSLSTVGVGTFFYPLWIKTSTKKH